MNLKNKLIYTGKIIYVVTSFAAGIGAGKLAYDFLHNQEQSTLKTICIGGLAALVGVFVSGALLNPTTRWFLPRCPECKFGRLHKTEETLETRCLKGGFHYYGIVLPDTEDEKIRENTFCDRCNYKTSRELWNSER